MKFFIRVLALSFCWIRFAVLAGTQEIQQFPLDEHRVYPVAVSDDRVTTISFPGPISAIEAVGVTVDGRTPGMFQIAHAKGSYFFSVRALVKKAVTNVNVRWNNETYVLELFETNEPVYSVIFAYADDQVSRPAPVTVTPERLLALLDKAKAFPLLKAFHPEAVADAGYINYASKPQIMDYKTYAIRIDEVFRFNPEDTLVFRVTLTNKTSQVLQYRPDGFSLRVGGRIYPQSISDANGVIPPCGTVPAYFAVTGTPDGGRNDISLKNEFIVIVQAIPVATSETIETNAPAPSGESETNHVSSP